MGFGITPVLLGIETQRARLEMSNNNKIDFKVSHTDPQLEIHSTPSKVLIDQSKAFEDAGLKGVKAFSDEISQLGRQMVSDYIDSAVAEGHRLAAIEKGGNPIAEMAREKMHQTYGFTFGVIPSHSPEFNVVEGTLDINLIPGEVNTAYNFTPIEMNPIPPQIRFYTIPKPLMDFQTKGNNLDVKV